MLREIDASIIAHWRERFASNESLALEAAVTSLGDIGYGMWLLSLGFQQDQLVAASESVEGCPWPAFHGKPEILVKQTFGASFAGTLSSMAERCVAVYRVIHYGYWLQIYVLKTAGGYRLMAGGPPNSQPAISDEFVESQWEVPFLLRTFYAVHDGFGPMESSDCFWFEDAILPTAALAPLTRYIHAGEDLAYTPSDCLMFSPDGGGNGYCFQRRSMMDQHPALVFWACQDRDVRNGPDFLGLLKQLTSIS